MVNEIKATQEYGAPLASVGAEEPPMGVRWRWLIVFGVVVGRSGVYAAHNL